MCANVLYVYWMRVGCTLLVLSIRIECILGFVLPIEWALHWFCIRIECALRFPMYVECLSEIHSMYIQCGVVVRRVLVRFILSRDLA